MKLEDIRRSVNAELAGELLTYREVVKFLDKTIDDINQMMNTVYPAFSELAVDATEYSYFPNRYIRSVVITGAAMYYYQADEEGVKNAKGYQQDYSENKFYMLRDYLHAVPEEYRDNTENGTIEMNNQGAFDEAGLHDGYTVMEL